MIFGLHLVAIFSIFELCILHVSEVPCNNNDKNKITVYINICLQHGENLIKSSYEVFLLIRVKIIRK